MIMEGECLHQQRGHLHVWNGRIWRGQWWRSVHVWCFPLPASKHDLPWPWQITGETKSGCTEMMICKKQLQSSYGFLEVAVLGLLALNAGFDKRVVLCPRCFSTLLKWLCLCLGLSQHPTASQSGAHTLSLPLLLSPCYSSHQLSSLLLFVVQVGITRLGQGLIQRSRRSLPVGGCVKHRLFDSPLNLTFLV